MTDRQTAWITGASSGIGEALAKEYAARGVSPILSGRNVAELDRVAGECGDTADPLVLPFEATDMDALDAASEQALGHRGRIDILVNNAGISQRSLAVNTDYAVYEKIVSIDLLAPIALTQKILPHMHERGSGRIIMISSVAGMVGSPLRTAYSAAKHGLIGYSDALRTEVEGAGLSVHVVAPGSVRTNVSRNALNADGSARGVSDKAIDEGLDPADVAKRIIDASEAGEREIIVAEGMERNIVDLRRSEPEKLFEMMAAMVAEGYAQKMGAES